MNKQKATLPKPVSGIWLGLFLITAGVLTAAINLHYKLPLWLVSWPLAIIAGGLLLGIYQRFKTIFWILPVFWGGYLMAIQQAPYLNLDKYIGEAAIILAGVVILGTKKSKAKAPQTTGRFGYAKDDAFVTANSFLCNTKINIDCQDFKEATSTTILGNTVIDLRNADMQSDARIDITVFLGNAKIYIPRGWVMRNNITTLLGDVRQKASHNNTNTPTNSKVIMFDGTAILGNIAIISC